MRRWLKWTLRVVAGVLGLAVLLALGGGLWLRGQLRASLPLLEGEITLPGLSAPVTLQRDELGVPSLRASNRVDLARATGFVHAQERFFQMDLLRRRAAGELAELIGAVAASADRQVRVHRFRSMVGDGWKRAERSHARLLEAYAEGVNSGLDALGAPPPEYVALRVDPRPWLPEDSTLVLLTMYLRLQSGRVSFESRIGLMREVLPPEVVAFLVPRGDLWDAPIVGDPLAPSPVPSPEVYDLRRMDPAIFDKAKSDPAGEMPFHLGSNNWAVGGGRTSDGRALLANDMHLGLDMPNIWFRADLLWADDRSVARRATGVTLPGTPAIIAGTNGRVAWGFTNSYGDWSDLVLLETDRDDDSRYLTPDGPESIRRFEERIAVKGADDEVLEVQWTRWGPVIDRDHHGRQRVLRWVAHDLDGVEMALVDMEQADTVAQALETAARGGIPAQNVVVADRDGRIGWTIMGPIPRRFGDAGREPVSWADGTSGWDGYLHPDEYPRIVDADRLWTANNRVVDGEMLARIGDNGFAHGARARQIRDNLREIENATERDMLQVQLDDRALFLAPWRELLLELLTDEATGGGSRRDEFARLVRESWTGHASVDSVGYRLVRGFRLYLAHKVFPALTAPCSRADETFTYFGVSRWETPLWQLVQARPAHLLPPDHESWEALMLSAVDAVIDDLIDGEEDVLLTHTWGNRNVVALRHPLSQAVPALGRWLDVPGVSLPGDVAMPRVQTPRFGASERMIVSPGREEDGLFHMPGGQSGHPFSPYYRKGHEAWVAGEATPLLPGPPVHTLTLSP